MQEVILKNMILNKRFLIESDDLIIQGIKQKNNYLLIVNNLKKKVLHEKLIPLNRNLMVLKFLLMIDIKK